MCVDPKGTCAILSKLVLGGAADSPKVHRVSLGLLLCHCLANKT